ncbi:hypothetical protein FA13DRAFT_963200 [Coprinellus micaceus]|uniref:Uncharacterized protein n=1 Tax=Coprinellus micaceus TaxID=71717 RepID=A0A4Y7RX27_COPMI|nr:hypothetical protein FA13DRAFT_963200 [Coprinellus micaceus]
MSDSVRKRRDRPANLAVTKEVEDATCAVDSHLPERSAFEDSYLVARAFGRAVVTRTKGSPSASDRPAQWRLSASPEQEYQLNGCTLTHNTPTKWAGCATDLSLHPALRGHSGTLWIGDPHKVHWQQHPTRSLVIRCSPSIDAICRCT